MFRKNQEGWPLQHSVFNDTVMNLASVYKQELVRESPLASAVLGGILQTYRNYFTLVNYYVNSMLWKP